ncbi:MAG: hypothetical protein AB7P04_13550 [Bacteriovoracia bacterium]
MKRFLLATLFGLSSLAGAEPPTGPTTPPVGEAEPAHEAPQDAPKKEDGYFFKVKTEEYGEATVGHEEILRTYGEFVALMKTLPGAKFNNEDGSISYIEPRFTYMGLPAFYSAMNPTRRDSFDGICLRISGRGKKYFTHTEHTLSADPQEVEKLLERHLVDLNERGAMAAVQTTFQKARVIHSITCR